ncbi:aminoacyl-tRNA hydrolase [bacterium]|nr:aminoacyl-tRNA hydrolase [bacterium]
MDEHYLLVGLGNPGAAYETTRHNLGFMIIDELTHTLKDLQTIDITNARVKAAKLGNNELILAKPLTYMNNSGIAVSGLVEKFNISLTHLLIILDDFNLPFGQLRLRANGSDGGHRGLESIIYQLQTTSFPRLRIGIGCEATEDYVDFVLGNFDEKEEKVLPEVVHCAAKAVLSFVQEGLTHTMNHYNRTTN